MRAQYKLRARTQYRQWNGSYDTWRNGVGDPTTITVEANDFRDAKTQATSMLKQLNYDWRYSFDIVEVIQIPENSLTIEGVLHS